MNEDAIIQYICTTFDDIHTVSADGTTFFFYSSERKFPFTTLVTNDVNDQASDLERLGAFRLNIGVSKQTFRSLFGEQPSPADGDSVDQGGYDFTAFDRLMPHPVYGKMYWVCVLNPSPATFETAVQPLLAEAYNMAVSKHDRRAQPQ